MGRPLLTIVIPALNEGRTIGGVVQSASRYGRVIVVDDASTDDTSQRASEAGASVVRLESNRGYDGAIDAGFVRAAELGADIIMTMDADGQHDPGRVEGFLAALDRGADVVVGARDRLQRFSERLFALLGRGVWRIRDPLCGMKAYRAGVYRALGHFDSYRSIGTELTLFAASRGLRIEQIEVKTRERLDAPRFGRKLSANLRILRALWIGLRRFPPPRGPDS